MLRVEDAEFYYDAGRKSGFTGVSFSVRRGEVLCILGPNGCGKTTLLKCLTGLYDLDSGRVWLDDNEMSELGRREVAKFVGYVPQIHQPAFPFSVLDAVLVGRAPHLDFFASPGKEDLEIAERAIDAMGISELRDRPYTQLSGGERQMVVFARVLAQQPSVLLLDEPTSHLDFGNQIRVLNLVEELASVGLSVVMTSHFPDHAFLSSNDVVVMKDHQVVASGPPEEVVTEEMLERIYGVKVRIVNLENPAGRRICVPLMAHSLSLADKGIILKRKDAAERGAR